MGTRLRGIGLGTLCALIGFSWALATSQSVVANSSVSTSPRSVGTGLRFSNPFLLPGQDAAFPNGGSTASDPSGFDLGDACYGSMIVRYLTALNGVQPYTFTSTTIGTTGLNLGSAGRVFGVVPAALGTFVKFNATVTDASGAARTGTFRLGTFNCPIGTFRFSHDRLSDARVGLDYITNIQVLGGDTTTVFSIVPGSVLFNGAPVSDIESLGLRLFDDGTIAGRPLKAGTLTFIARAQSSTGLLARNRSNTAPDQPLTVNIGTLDTVETVLGTLASTISGSFTRPGHDLFSYTAFINTNGLNTSDFANAPITVRLGGKTFTTTLDSRGQSRFGNVRVAFVPSRGTLRLSLRNQDFSALFGLLPDQSKKIVVVEIQIGEKFLGTEPIQFAVVNRHGHYRLIYGLYRSRQVGGLFQVIAVRANDSFSGTAFQTKFLISQVPDSSSEFFGSPNDAVVNIGPAFTEDVPLFNGRGFFRPPGIAAVNIQTRRRAGLISTYPLPASQTGIQPARQSNGQPQTFLLGLKVTTNTLTFNGASSEKIFPFRF